MRPKLLAIGCFCLLTACAYHKDVDVEQHPTNDGRSLEFETIGLEVFKELDIDPKREVLLGFKDGRPATVFLAPGQDVPKAMKFPEGRTLRNLWTLIKTQDSPPCIWTHDGAGGRDYYPLPPGCEIPG